MKQSQFFLGLVLYNIKRAEPLNIDYGNVKIKQYSKVTDWGCILDETLQRESMTLHNLNRINSRIKFLCRKQIFKKAASETPL